MNELKNKTFKVLSMGCKVNYYECEAVSKMLKDNGFLRIDDDSVADVCIINTCTVTEEGSRKSKQMIRRMIKENPGSVVVVMGCLNQVDDSIKDIEGTSVILGVNNKNEILNSINEFYKTKKQIIKLDETDKLKFENYCVDKFEAHTRAFLKVEDGCNNFCSYCIIPYARGRSRSKQLDEIIKEAHVLVDNGHKEIVITGIDTGFYGKDINSSLYELLNELCKIDGLKRIRISSIEITQINDDIISLMKNNSKIARHLHIPIQSGSDRILKLMNRHYDKKYFIEKVEHIRNMIDDITITTDLISGFPTETEEDFIETLDTINKIGFDTIHAFPYSLRKGTIAAKMEQLNPVIKKERSLKVLEISKENYKKLVERHIGYTEDVVFETIKNGEIFGHTGNYIYVKTNGTIEDLNKIKYVVIDKFDEKDSICHIVK